MCNDSRREDSNAIERSRESPLNKVNTVGKESSKNTNWSDTGGKKTENMRDPGATNTIWKRLCLKHGLNLHQTTTEAGKNSKQNQHQTGLNAGFKIKQEMQKKIQIQTECLLTEYWFALRDDDLISVWLILLRFHPFTHHCVI